MSIGDHPSPAKSNPLGTKGCGEAGCAGSLVCIVNAVLDALAEYGTTEIDTPERDPGWEGEEGGVAARRNRKTAQLYTSWPGIAV